MLNPLILLGIISIGAGLLDEMQKPDQKKEEKPENNLTEPEKQIKDANYEPETDVTDNIDIGGGNGDLGNVSQTTVDSE